MKTTTAIALLLTMPLATSCSAVFSTPPPPNHESLPYFTCSDSYVLPGVDTLAGVVDTVAGLAGVAADEGGDTAGIGALAIALGALHFVSASHGTTNTNSCREAMAKWAQRMGGGTSIGIPGAPYSMSAPPAPYPPAAQAMPYAASIPPAAHAVVPEYAPAQAMCRNDMDCKGERVCNVGICMDPQPVRAAPTKASSNGVRNLHPENVSQAATPEPAVRQAAAPAATPTSSRAHATASVSTAAAAPATAPVVAPAPAPTPVVAPPARAKWKQGLGVAVELTSAPMTRQGGGTGLVVTNVRAGSPAEAAGLQKSDILLKLGATPLDSKEALRRAIEKLEVGVVMVELRRAGKSLRVGIELQEPVVPNA